MFFQNQNANSPQLYEACGLGLSLLIDFSTLCCGPTKERPRSQLGYLGLLVVHFPAEKINL